MEAVTGFLFLGSKITVKGECRHEIKRCLLLEKKAMTNLRQHIKKQRHYFVDKAIYSQSYFFSSNHEQMWELDHKEGWAQEMMLSNWCWRRLLRVSWTARRLSQSVIKQINPEYSLGGLMLELELQYSGHLMQRANSLEKTLILGKIEGRRRREGQRLRCWMASPTLWTWVWASSRR